MKITMEQVLEGTVNLDKIKVSDLAEFVEEHGLNVTVQPKGIAKKVIMNQIVDAVELMDEANADAQVVPVVETEDNDPKPEPKPVVHYRKSGEIIRLSKGGNDYGSNWANRQGR